MHNKRTVLLLLLVTFLTDFNDLLLNLYNIMGIISVSVWPLALKIPAGISYSLMNKHRANLCNSLSSSLLTITVTVTETAED